MSAALARPAAAPATPLRVALVGNPNTGKSTLFNALTGLRQRVANFPGVTVERAVGSYRSGGIAVTLTDLPGSYSLDPDSIDEQIAHDALLGRIAGLDRPDVVVVVVDAEQLERNLFFATQVIELGLPTVIALNHMDAVERRGVRVDVPELIHELGVTVIPVVATRGVGVETLRRAIGLAPSLPRATWRATRRAARAAGEHGADDARRRYARIGAVVAKTVTRPALSRATPSDLVDRVALHPLGGPLLFVALMALVFQAVFAWSEPATEGIERLLGALAGVIAAAMPAGDLRALLSDGVVGGVGSVLAFVPQITLLFLCIGALEESGYMARAAFMMDRHLRPLGLHGRSFIPLLSGYACAVPAILSARTIQSPRDRLATILVVPLVSCSARLPVYALLIAAAVPAGARVAGVGARGLLLLAMYALGTVAALAVAALARRTLLRGPMRPMLIELPAYSVPQPRTLAISAWHRASQFLRRAGTLIFAVSVALWALSTYPKAPGAEALAPEAARELSLSHSALGRMGRVVEPAVRPLGFDWKIGVGILASFTAREVFVTTTAATRPDLTPLVALGLMVFYVFAPMCASTLAVTAREAGGGTAGLGWAALQFAYMLSLAWVAALAVRLGGRAMGLA